MRVGDFPSDCRERAIALTLEQVAALITSTTLAFPFHSRMSRAPGGGNRAAATAIGINTGRVKLAAFAIAGGMAAVAGILATSRVGSVQPGQGAGLELQAIAACVIGGLSLSGGRGSIVGIFLGVMLIHTITDVLLLMRAPGFYLDMFIATLIVVAASFNHLIERRGAA